MPLPATLPATLLVPGWSDTARSLHHARSFLLRAGWPQTHVGCVDFRNRYGSNIQHAAEVEAALELLLERTGSPSAALVAHSMGGLAVREYLARAGDAAPVHTAVFVGTPHRGTWVAYLAWGRGGAEMRPGSEFLRRLAQKELPRHVRATCIRTPFDTHVVPGSSAALPGADCRLVRLPTHPRMLRHGPTLRLIRELLTEAA
jgi:triacylglycerol lipase